MSRAVTSLSVSSLLIILRARSQLLSVSSSCERSTRDASSTTMVTWSCSCQVFMGIGVNRPVSIAYLPPPSERIAAALPGGRCSVLKPSSTVVSTTVSLLRDSRATLVSETSLAMKALRTGLASMGGA